MDGYSLGQILREAREAKEITIEDAVAKLRIRQPILEAFEAGEFEIAGVPEIQIRGMLRIYGRFLELDEEDVLQLYDRMRLALEKGRRRSRGRRRRREEADTERILSATQPLQEAHLAERRSATCGSLLRVLLILLFSAAAIAVIVYVTVELVGIENNEAPGPAAETTIPPPTETEAPPATDTVAVAPTASGRAQYGGSGILVSILVTQRSWMQVRADGVEQFSGIATPETLLEYSAVSEVRLAAANAMALDVIWNGQQQEQIGGRGQRADMRFTATEAIVELGPAGAPTPVSPTAEAVVVAAEDEPTATERPSPTPTDTLIPSETPIPTMTHTSWPTITPIPSATPGPTTAILPPRVTQAGLPPTKEGA
jgi:cytoskeletal protein RodZ